VRLGPLAPRPAPTDDVASALSTAAATLGQRPAVTVITPDGRQEQGFVSLAGWAAKGAHLLRDELGLGPGDVLGVDAPPSWPLAAVALAAWWAGVALGPVAPGRPAVVHEGRADPGGEGGEVWWLGDAIDGGPLGAIPAHGEAWTAAVIPHPDRPPAPGASPDAIALVDVDGRVTTQRELLAAWQEDEGVLGLLRTEPATPVRADVLDMLGALAARPLGTGLTTVVVGGVTASADTNRLTVGDRVARWL
jgi:hypothetical protein